MTHRNHRRHEYLNDMAHDGVVVVIMEVCVLCRVQEVGLSSVHAMTLVAAPASWNRSTSLMAIS
jgi:hypothetical protein